VVSGATLQSVEISPSTPTISTAVLGVKRQLTLLGHYSDGTAQYLTESASWSSSVTTKATISNTAGSKGLATSTGYGTTVITATYSGFTVTATLTVQQPTVTSIAIAPSAPTIASGTAIQLTAVATYTDGSTQTITSPATWSSSDTAVARVSNTSGSIGLTTAIAPGTATITATYNGVSGTAGVTVTAVSGATGRFVYAGNVSSSTVSGYILDQATGGLTGVPGSPIGGFYTSPLSVTSHPSGRFVYVGHSYGVTGFSSDATTGQLTQIPGGYPYFGYTGTPPNPQPSVYALTSDPTGRYVYAANQNAGTVSAYMVDGGNGALTPIGTYPAGPCPYSVTVDPSGKFVYVANNCGPGPGVWAYAIDGGTGALTPVSGSPFGGISATAVTAAPNGQVLYAISSNSLRGYTINSTTGALTLISGFPVATSVCCTYYSGLTVDPTGRFLYAAASSGSVSAFSIDAVTGGMTAVAGSPFAVAPNNQSYGASVDASGKFLYVSSYANTSGSPGAVVALAINQTTGALTAAPGSPFATGGNGTYSVTTTGAVVSGATLQSVEISPSTPTISTAVLGVKRQLTLLGHYSDGTTQYLTESASWSSSVTTKATISNTAGSKGLATSTGYGTTVITATYSGFTVTATLTVQQPTVTSIAIAPSAPTIASGTAIQLTAVATYTDGSTQTITSLATWSSSDTAVATVSNSSGSQGLTTAIAPGTATITATYNGVSGTASITVQ
jgi:6-phosphogluconolactonase (cycloisomerase 2 family)